MAYFLGIDGGGTKTRCVLGDERSVLGEGSSTSCRVQRVGEACAQDALAAAIHEACVQAAISLKSIARTCAGITGAARLEIASTMRGLLTKVVGGEIETISDFEIAFEDAFSGGPGVLVIAGTGSIAWGRNGKGQTARAGGWGPAISDEGSGYWIGAEAVRCVLRAHDQGNDSLLLKRLMEAIAADSFDDFIVRVNAQPQPDYAALFPTVLSAAVDRGDGVAITVLERAGKELAMLAETVVQRMFPQAAEASMATHGGVLTNSEHVRESFRRNLRAANPHIVFESKSLDPARGALNRARRMGYE
jgi:N-acetylglucosamine kinase-like BadF-type ATPase